MPILERYRKRQPRRGIPYARLWSLTALLCLIVLAMVIATRRQARPPADEIRHSEAAPAEPAETEPPFEGPAAEWRPLTPEEERELLSNVVDQVPLGVREHREAYYYLINKVHRMSPDEMAERLDKSATYDDFGMQPHILRGNAVEVKGVVMRLEKTKLNPGEAGLSAVWEGQLAEREFTGRNPRLFTFVLTEPPQPPFREGLRMRDGVYARLRGVFMQVIVYQDRNDPPRDIASPLIIARRLRQAPAMAREPGRLPALWIVLTGILAVLIAARMALGLFRKPAPKAR